MHLRALALDTTIIKAGVTGSDRPREEAMRRWGSCGQRALSDQLGVEKVELAAAQQRLLDTMTDTCLGAVLHPREVLREMARSGARS